MALFPAPPPHPSARAAFVGYLHFASGTVLFVSLSVIALWLFRRTSPDSPPTPRKLVRDRIYLICGIVMVASLALAGLAELPFGAGLSHLNPVFWMESAAIVAFGVSWLVKGQAVLPDEPAPPAGWQPSLAAP